MLTAIKDDETVLESIQAGADGYLTKDRAADDVVQAVRAAYAGETLLPRSVIVEIARRVAAARSSGDDRTMIEPLTPRELEVLRALTDGLSTPEICERLYIAPNTLRTHVQNIMGKLRVHSKLEAVAFAPQPPRGAAAGRGRRLGLLTARGSAGLAQRPIRRRAAGAVGRGAAPSVAPFVDSPLGIARAGRARPASRPGGGGRFAAPRRVARCGGTRRSADSVAPPRTAIRVARPCRSVVHTTSRRVPSSVPPEVHSCPAARRRCEALTQITSIG